jgi:hypothetical protein
MNDGFHHTLMFFISFTFCFCGNFLLSYEENQNLMLWFLSVFVCHKQAHKHLNFIYYNAFTLNIRVWQKYFNDKIFFDSNFEGILNIWGMQLWGFNCFLRLFSARLEFIKFNVKNILFKVFFLYFYGKGT